MAEIKEKSTKDDLSTAILRGKDAPSKLVVQDQETEKDNSACFLHPNTMEKLQLFRGDTIRLKGKRRHETVLIAMSDETLPEKECRINKGKK